MTKKNIMPVAVLTSICIVVAILLAVVNMFTEPVIKANAERAEQESLAEVLPGASGFDAISTEGAPDTVKALYRERSGLGYVALLKTKTSYTHGTDMAITVGVGSDGKITGIKLTAYSESKDIGKDYPNKFVGLDAGGVGAVDAVSGVTYSSNAFKDAVADALAAVSSLIGETKDELTLEAQALIEGSNLKDVTPASPAEGVIRVWLDENGGGYVVNVKTKTQYVDPDTSTLVAVGNDDKVIKIKILTWVHGEGTGYTEDFVNSFEGKDESGIDGVDVITGSTGTSNNVKNAVKLAISTVKSAKENALKTIAETLISNSNLKDITPETPAEGLLHVWKDENGGGYVVNISTKTQYVDPDTSTLVAVGNDGKVIKIKIITWVHGEGTSFTEEFENAFSGKDTAGVDGVDAITGSTGTSNSVKTAVKTAISVVEEIKKDLLREKAEALIGAESLKAVAVSNPKEGVKYVWHDEVSGAYVVNITTKTQYVDPDTSTLVAVGSDGKVIKIKILTWVHGEGTAYTEDFVNSFEGKDTAGVDGVDAITGSTGTSNNVKNAVKLAISQVSEIKGGN